MPLLQGGWAGGGKFGNVFSFFSKFTAHKALQIKGSPPCKGVLELDMDMDATGAFSHCLCKCKIRSVGRKRLIIKFPPYRFYGCVQVFWFLEFGFGLKSGWSLITPPTEQVEDRAAGFGVLGSPSQPSHPGSHPPVAG